MALLKKTFAVVLAVGLVLSCLTVSAAAATPAINVSTAYVKVEDVASASTDVTLELHTRNFDNIYAAQFTVDLPDGLAVVANSVTTKSGLAWTENTNYVLNGNDIKFLDVRTTEGFDVQFKVTVPQGATEDYAVSIVNYTFLDKNEAEFDNVAVDSGAIVMQETASTETVTGTTGGYFIPYGSVTDADGNYVEKGDTGDFTTGGNVVSSFKLPSAEIGVTTFGASERKADAQYDAGIQFGSYAVDSAEKTYGTLVIMGDFEAFKAYYSSMTETEIYNRFAELYANNTPEDGTLKVTYNNKAGSVVIGCVAQTKYMWKGTVNGVEHLQYAVRITNPTPRTYTSVAYNVADTTYTFSEEVKVWTVAAQ